MTNEMQRPGIQWQPLIEMIIVLVTILGSTIPLYLQSDNKIAAIQNEMRSFHRENLNEMKDFHGRLCIIEANRSKS